MLLSALAIALVAFPAFSVLAGQIPAPGGVIGDVPKPPSAKFPQFNKDSKASPAATTPGKLRIVENSGVCETTPGVYQASGYGDLTSSESIW